MKNSIDPTEIKSIKSNTPVTITFDDGSTITAYNFIFEDTTHYATRDDEAWEVSIRDDYSC